ncbi:hypothetical protein GYMLUDRAFT_371404 [Collybiopsis luxurians FD-317 M1]|uniref:non-specific serine/threonine protein kinase n=1 Tax=Collybiopsis luxurians FD-317 M1 TaxID=944289 RepID=A0A0D0BR64_9AGAR|nr:hypothetical protein GYMLUDRAFT_371404 [Collybiopsis luxurians FD-317 M1]
MENQPELLLVVSSDDGPTLSELLFQGASVISFVNWIHDKGMNSSPKFTLPLIYVDNAFHALIYVMREHDDKFLYTQIADLNLNQLSASIRFLKFLYRYAATRSRIDDQLAEAWARCISLQTGSIHCVHGSRLVDNVNVHRLRLKPNRAHLPYGTGLPLLSVHDDSGGIFRIRLGGTSFVIKKVRGHSQEHRVLERVARWRAHGALCAKFIAPLIGRISLYGDYVVLPFLRSFYDIFLLADIGPTAFRLTVELASAIQFLHDNHIAHLDIKPDNLALTSDWVLQVLDFGMSVFVTNEDQMVYGRCGTEGFMAPEIQSEGVFSPIRADRFSTGCVFLYLARLTYKDLGLDTFGKMLTNEDPLDRPALQQWRDQNSGGLYSDPALL